MQTGNGEQNQPGVGEQPVIGESSGCYRYNAGDRHAEGVWPG